MSEVWLVAADLAPFFLCVPPCIEAAPETGFHSNMALSLIAAGFSNRGQRPDVLFCQKPGETSMFDLDQFIADLRSSLSAKLWRRLWRAPSPIPLLCSAR